MIDPLGVVGVVLAEKFRVDRLLGEGGFGVVYAGVHLVLGEPIAVKFIKIEGLVSDPSRAAEEYLREARILFSLSHPAIVRMYDVGALERGTVRTPWVVLELLSGPTLEQEISQRRGQGRQWSAAELLEIFDPILDGLAFAHGRGIMHRDIKPSNVLLSRAASGRLEPKLVDFGTARSQISVFQESIGKTGFTPLYGAPEQWDPSIGPPTPATDVYALGLTLLECATLRRPHGAADSLPAIMRAVMEGAGDRGLSALRPDLGPSLGSVVERALARHPSQRFGDARELRAAVGAVLAGASQAPSGMSPGASTMGPFVPSTPPPLGYRTTAPLVATPHARPSASGHGIIAMVVAALGLVAALGAVAVVGLLYFRGGELVRRSDGPSASPSLAAAKAISPPNVRNSEEFDRADAVGVAQKNHRAIEACAARSHRFNGTIDVVLDVSAKDGRVVGTDCQTVWPSHDSKHPKLDPEAAELCACIQSATASWKFKPPKPEFAMPVFEDSVSLHVHYVAAR